MFVKTTEAQRVCIYLTYCPFRTAEELAEGLGLLCGMLCLVAWILLASMAGTPLSANMFHRVPTRRASVLVVVKRRAAPAQSARASARMFRDPGCRWGRDDYGPRRVCKQAW